MINEFLKGYFFLSNFYPHHAPIADIDYPDIEYPTVEHAFQASKTANRSDRMRFAELGTPSEAKFVGRHLELRSDWEDVKRDMMYFYVKEKFEDPKMKERLLATGDEYLEEGNDWHDNIWGNCHCKRCADKEGLNWLGEILMEVREELKERA